MKAPLERLRAAMADRGIDALLVTDLSNVGWLTGFSGSAGRVVVPPTDALFLTDGRYTIQAEQEVKNMATASFGPPSDYDTFTTEQIKLLGIPKISFEAANLTYAGFEKLKGKLGDVELLSGLDLFGALKLVKDVNVYIGDAVAWADWLPDGRHLITGGLTPFGSTVPAVDVLVDSQTDQASPFRFLADRNQDLAMSTVVVP